MASINKHSSGRRSIQYVGSDGRRKTISLGQCDSRTAEGIRLHVERLAFAQAANQSPPIDTARWLASIGDKLHGKLAGAGLCTGREAEQAPVLSLKSSFDAYLARRTDLKPSTRIAVEQARDKLVEFFGADRDFTTINTAEVKDWRRKLQSEYADGYTAKLIAKAKTFFNDAVEREQIMRSPFKGVKGGSEENRERIRYISRETIAAVIDATPDLEWRAIIALARYGGLRCTSEHFALTWADVDWARDRMTIRSVKTEHHEGKDLRVVPIFPELRPHLEALFDAAEPGTVHVINRLRRPNANLRTTFLKIIARAGVSAWPRLFQNLRASAAMDVAARHPAHVAAEWMGHSVNVAKDHYLKAKDDDFEKALHQALQSPADRRGQERTDTPAGALKNPGKAVGTAKTGVSGMAHTGLEPVTSSVSCWRSSQLS